MARMPNSDLGICRHPLEAVMSRALHTLTITCQTGDVAFEFIADRPVLDYLSTIAERGTSDDEKLRSEQDLVDWINQSGILDSAPPVTQQTLERGKALREAMFRLIAALINHQTAGGTDCTSSTLRPRRRHPSCDSTTTDCTATGTPMRSSPFSPGTVSTCSTARPSGLALVRGRELHPRLH
jgi:hypothetical protein